jgi:hypothetical protein
MKSRWLACCLNTLILIILIQQPEPSGNEAGESWVRNRVREILPTNQSGILFICSEAAKRWSAMESMKVGVVFAVVALCCNSLRTCKGTHDKAQRSIG